MGFRLGLGLRLRLGVGLGIGLGSEMRAWLIVRMPGGGWRVSQNCGLAPGEGEGEGEG